MTNKSFLKNQFIKNMSTESLNPGGPLACNNLGFPTIFKAQAKPKWSIENVLNAFNKRKKKGSKAF